MDNRQFYEEKKSGEILAYIGFYHIRSGTGDHHLTSVEDYVFVHQFAGEIEILFDQQDRHIATGGQRADNFADILDNRRLDTLCRFIQQQEFRACNQCTADRQLLLLRSELRILVLLY